MTLPLTATMAMTEAPPVMEARRWLDGVTFAPDRPLINVSQAAPMEAPPEGLRRAIAEAALNDPSAHLYGPVLGLPALRAEIADQWSAAYGGEIEAAEVAITQGCNQAFCAIMATIARAGDEVLLPTPWYFNHKMWLDMQGVTAVPLPAAAGLIPDPAAAAALLTERTRAIVLVTPNNPGGVEYPAETVRAFYELARDRGLALILDETYRDFDSRPGAPHDLFGDPGWRGTLVHLYSFSKAFRLTGHRVGAIVADAGRLAEVEKFLDTVAICPNQLGQIAALWGMRNLSQWVAGERAEILARRAAIEAGFATLPGWRLLGAGAFFAYARHPFDLPSPELARRLVREAGVLLLPGTMFRPARDPEGAHEVRIAFANIDVPAIGTLIERLRGLRP
ncbi:MAG: aminotransferase [Rhodobacteraceae bacterium]|jgi:aspartate/methionine/tyrosine aminotransferase|uniref:aminotransferase n=1 Tax=Albidovulum sp. TaxID=1872424 RepID=UPI001D722191|nr:aminotransferase [uncultured Defluviimonas sp.]MCB2125001.1 aminotransferase [Paracoccaceae bacterium]MCC0068555.1 aminotransferase [Paracoccaceae bacterium]